MSREDGDNAADRVTLLFVVFLIVAGVGGVAYALLTAHAG